MPNNDNNNKKDIPPSVKLGFAAVSSCIEHTFMHPLDACVHRWQNGSLQSSAPMYSPQAWRNFNQVVFMNNGATTLFSKASLLFKGFFASGFHKTVARTYKYGAQPYVAKAMENQLGEKANKHVIGAVAGAAVGFGEIMFTPLDSFKIKRQLGYKGGFWQLLRTERWQLYNGMWPAAARNVPGSFALFLVSSSLKEKFARANKVNDVPNLTLQQHFTAASAGAIASMVITNPQEVVKTRVMAQHGKVSSLSVFKQTLKNEGPTAFWKGLVLRSIFSIPKLGIPLTLSLFLPEAYQRYVESAQPRGQKL